MVLVRVSVWEFGFDYLGWVLNTKHYEKWDPMPPSLAPSFCSQGCVWDRTGGQNYRGRGLGVQDRAGVWWLGFRTVWFWDK